MIHFKLGCFHSLHYSNLQVQLSIFLIILTSVGSLRNSSNAIIFFKQQSIQTMSPSRC